MGILLAINVDKQPMLPSVYAALKEIFHNPTEPFFTGRVMDLLFDGVPIDCSSQVEVTTQALCTQFDAGAQAAIQKVADKQFKFSVFGGVSVQCCESFVISNDV